MKKLIISSDALNKAMKKLGQAVNPKSILPILSNMHCKASKGSLELTTSDTEVTISTRIDAEVQGEFEMLLPFKYVHGIVALLGSQPITIELLSKTKAKLAADKDVFDINSLAKLEDFPQMPTVPKKNVVSLNDGFVELLGKAMLTVIEDDKLPAIQNACLDITPKKATLASTDRYCVFTHTIPLEYKEPERLLFSPKTAKILEGFKELEVSWTQKQVAIKAGYTTVWITRSDDKFPDYTKVMPNHAANLYVNKHDLTVALNKACLSSNPYKKAKLFFKKSPDLVHFEVEDPDFDRYIHLSIVGQYSGETESVEVNARKLLTILDQVEGDEIKLHISTASGAILISSKDDEGYLGLLMPIMQN